ncbi:MAG: diphthamide synthesis protein [Candidatus Altiarchaeota archaeon]|nr:diphthamide synthesis protein [Candidatus Altiarchaeota archaeon]
MKVLHVPCYHCKDVLIALRKNISVLSPYRRIGVVATAQHLNQLGAVVEFLNSCGKEAIAGGQVLGCSQEAALGIEKKVDCILYIGSGMFHPAGLSAKSEKPVILLNPYSETLAALPAAESERYRRRQTGRLAKYLAAGTIGILVSTKTGQFSLKRAREFRKKIISGGKTAFIFAGEELSPANLLPFKVDCWVNTACPRMVDDHYDRPVVNLEEVESLSKM